MSVLDELITDIRAAAGMDPLVVFDLDDTLLSTARRHLRILREYAAQKPQADLLSRVKPDELRYSIIDTAKAAGLEDQALLEELRGYWFARFFTNDYLREDAPVTGAAAYCRDVRTAGAGLVYLTGRDESMKEGTMVALGAHGFPVPNGAGVTLILKPRFETPDLEFKNEALRRLQAMGTVAGSFENEPSHINLFQAAFPKGRNVFVDTKHSGKPVAPHASVPWIKDFRRA